METHHDGGDAVRRLEIEIKALRVLLLEVFVDVGHIAARHGIRRSASIVSTGELSTLEPEVLEFLASFQGDVAVRLNAILDRLEGSSNPAPALPKLEIVKIEDERS